MTPKVMRMCIACKKVGQIRGFFCFVPHISHHNSIEMDLGEQGFARQTKSQNWKQFSAGVALLVLLILTLISRQSCRHFRFYLPTERDEVRGGEREREKEREKLFSTHGNEIKTLKIKLSQCRVATTDDDCRGRNSIIQNIVHTLQTHTHDEPNRRDGEKSVPWQWRRRMTASIWRRRR